MVYTKRSTLTGKLNQMDLDITQEQIDTWKSGKLIQNVMPHLSAEEREFLISGTTPSEWKILEDLEK